MPSTQDCDLSVVPTLNLVIPWWSKSCHDNLIDLSFGQTRDSCFPWVRKFNLEFFK